MTVGSIPRHLLRFSIPMLIGNLIQIGYSIINTIWVGHLVGENAVGAIGVSFPCLFHALRSVNGYIDGLYHTHRPVLRGKKI